jgi:hypothetical protein
MGVDTIGIQAKQEIGETGNRRNRKQAKQEIGETGNRRNRK